MKNYVISQYFFQDALTVQKNSKIQVQIGVELKIGIRHLDTYLNNICTKILCESDRWFSL